jgi:UDP-glucose 4-epimerase
MSANKVVVTVGGSGFIGRHLICELLKDTNDVINIDPVPLINNATNYRQITTLTENFIDTLGHLVPNNCLVYYLASSSVPGKDHNIFEDYLNSVKPFFDFIDAIKDRKPQIIFLSSAGTVYGETNEANKESDPLNPISIYGIHKIIIEKYLFYFSRHFNLNYRIARISNPYGNKVPHGQGIGVIDELERRFKSKKPIKIYASLETKRDYIHINDVVNGLIKISNFDIHLIHHVFNISSGISYTLEEVIKIFEKKFNYNITIHKEPSRSIDIMNSAISNDLIRDTFGFFPKYNLTEYINKIS